MICRHGITDDCTVTSKTVVEDMMEGTRWVTQGFWCPVHRLFGTSEHKETFDPKVTFESLGVGV